MIHPPPLLGSSPITTAPIGVNAQASEGLGIHDYWRVVARQKWKIASLALFAAVLAGAVGVTLPPIFRSTTTLLVEPGKAKIVSIENIRPHSEAQEAGRYQTQVELLRSSEIAERTIRALRLWDHEEFDPRLAEGTWLGRLTSRYLTVRDLNGHESWLSVLERLESLISRERVPALETEDDLITATLHQFAKALKIEPLGLSQLVNVSFESKDRSLAAQVANRHAEEYIQADRDARVEVAEEVGLYLSDRLRTLRHNLDGSERELQEYRDANGIVSLGGSAQTMAAKEVGDMSERLVEARSRRVELESAYQQVTNARTNDLSEIPLVVRSASVNEAQREVNEAKRRLAELSESLGPNHIRIQQIESELTQLNSSLRQQRSNVVASIRRDYEAARTTEQAIERGLDVARQKVREVNRDEFRLAALEREVSANRQLYDMFLSRSKETGLASEVQAPVARIVDRAREAQAPVRPAKLQLVFLAALFALVLGSLAAVVLHHLDRSIKGVEEAELQLGMPVLTVLPQVSVKERDQLSRSFIESPYSPHAEGIRTAQTGVMLSGIDTTHKIVLVTSALPGEGKTTFACNIALAHAQTQRTLLIDADMRRSQASQRLGLALNAKGLTNLLAGTAPVQDSVQLIDGSQLRVMPVGNVLPMNPLDLLLSHRFQIVIKSLSEQFDVIVIDSPPLELVSDALALASLATSTIVVIKAMATPAAVVRRTISRLVRNRTSNLFAVLNCAEPAESKSYDRYGVSAKAYLGPIKQSL